MAKYSFIEFWRSQRTPVPPLIRADLTGQTVVVIGANVGLGFGAAKHFATMKPARLILACRSRAKGEAAVQELKQETGYNQAEVRILDLASFASVSAFASELEKEDARVDVLVANAAVGIWSYEVTQDGWEQSLQVNHLSTTLLCLLLLPRMIHTARTYNTMPRMTIVTSDLHMVTNVSDELLAKPNVLRHLSNKDYCSSGAVMRDRYNITKLFNVFMSRALTERLPPASPIVINSVNPGYCASELRRNTPFPLKQIFKFFDSLIARTNAEGASTIVWAALAGTAGEPSSDLRDRLRGAYSNDWKVGEASDYVLSEKGNTAQERIWKETIEILEEQNSSVRGIVNEFLSRK